MSDVFNPLSTFEQTPSGNVPQTSLGFTNPLQAMSMGNNVGTTMANNRVIQQNNVNAQQALVQQQQLAAQKQQQQQLVAQQAQEDARQKQARIIELSRKLAGKRYPGREEDMAELAQLSTPDNFKQMQEASKAMSLEQKTKLFTTQSTVQSLLKAGNVEHVTKYLGEQEQLARDGGDRDTLETVMLMKQVVADGMKKHGKPEVIANTLDYGMIGFDGWGVVSKAMGEQEAQPGARDKTASETTENLANADKLAEEAVSERELRPYEKALSRSQKELNDRLPQDRATGGGGDGNAPPLAGDGSLSEVDSNIAQINNVLEGFENFAAKGEDLPAGWLGIPATIDDVVNMNGEKAQWRGQAQSALITPILKKLVALRPASDTDVKMIIDAVGNIKDNPIKAMNALQQAKQLLEVYRQSIIAERSYAPNDKETKQQYLDRVLPYTKPVPAPYGATKEERKGLDKLLDLTPVPKKTVFTKGGQPIAKKAPATALPGVGAPLPSPTLQQKHGLKPTPMVKK